MKNFFTLLLFMFSVINLSAQENLEFLGISTNESVETFCNHLKQKGFKLKKHKKANHIFTGEFMGYKKCKIVVEEGQKDSSIESVCVWFPEYKNSKKIEENYYQIKKQLNQEIGSPVSSVEEFNGKENFFKGNFTFHSLYKVQGGHMKLEIIHKEFKDFDKCYIYLNYLKK